MGERSQTLIGLITCARDRAWLEACRETWVRDVQDADVVTVDHSFLPEGIPDCYENLPQKTRALCQYAKEHGYSHILKIDNDTFLRPRLLVTPKTPYAGRLRGPSGGYPADFCSGGAYWLSRIAIEIVANMELTADTAEDRTVGNELLRFGIKPTHIPGYTAPTHVPVTDYLRSPTCVALMQIEDPAQMVRAYKGVFDPPVRPAGSEPNHFPQGSPLRSQMKSGPEWHGVPKK